MAEEIKINIPDIGGATGVDVIEVMVKPGDTIAKDSPLITLESDKASMEIPSPEAGEVKSILLKVGDKVSEGDAILTLIGQKNSNHENVASAKQAEPEAKKETSPSKEANHTERLEVRVPDIGGAQNVDVIEIMVKPGDAVKQEQSLITLEGDKATMDIPSPAQGVVEEISLKIGDKVSQGSLILILNAQATEEPAQEKMQTSKSPEQKEETTTAPEKIAPPSLLPNEQAEGLVLGSPAVRRLARELGVDLQAVRGSGRKSRITKEDIQQYVKTRLSEQSSAGFSVPKAPSVDFKQFGEIEVKPLNKIKRLTGANLHRAWLTIPHVTQFDEADITELEQFRKSATENSQQSNGYKLTMLAFVTKVVAKALTLYPQFNASLDASGENLIYKHYFNIGIAVETPQGLVVPVIKNVEQLSVNEIAAEMGRLSQKARDKALLPADMNGGCFTISSLGGIGGTAFTPIVNSPEVAILGLSRSAMKPVFIAGEFKPRLMLPLSLSYDHRVIDGAEAARFTRYISDSLSDIRRILL